MTISELVAFGWHLEGDTVYSPSRGLWLDPSHFGHWNPQEMCEVFTARAKRIEIAQIGDTWETAAKENHQVHQAIENLKDI